MPTESEIIYRHFSLFSFIGSIISRLIFFVVIFYLMAHLSENPALISILAFLALIILIFDGDDQIVLTNTELIFTGSSIMIWIFGWGKIKYDLEEIKSVYLRPPTTATEFGVGLVLAFFLPKTIYRDTIPLFIDFNNGNTIRKDISSYALPDLKKLANNVNNAIGRLPRE